MRDAYTAVAVTAGKELIKKSDSYLGLVLKPMLTTVGKELDERVKEKFEEMKAARRNTNLAHHIRQAENLVASRPAKRRKKSLKTEEDAGKSAVGSTTDTSKLKEQPPEPSVQAIDGVEKWIKGAQDVDPDDNIMAPIWQDLLVDLLSNESVDEVVIEALRVIKSHELTALLRVARPHPGPFKRALDSSIEKALIEKGLLHKTLSPWVPWCVGALVFSVFFVVVIPSFLSVDFVRDEIINTKNNETEHLEKLARSFGALLALLSVSTSIMLWMGAWFSIYSLRPTWLAQEILLRVERIRRSHEVDP